MKKKYIKIAGYIVTIVCIIFLIHRLINLDFDYGILLETKSLLVFATITVLFTIHLVMLPMVWRQTLIITTGASVSYIETTLVYARSNLMKYIPGNIFQYVGRNEMALRKNLSHIDVALSTVLDVGAIIIATAITALILYFPVIRILLEHLLAGFIPMAILAGCLIILIVCIIIFRKRFIKAFDKLIMLFSFKSLLRYSICILYYMFWSFFVSVLFSVILYGILGYSASILDFRMIMGAYLVSWIVGFITPGSPSGFGVKEVVFAAIMSGQVTTDIIIPGIIIFRLVTTVSDFLAFFTVTIISWIQQRLAVSKAGLPQVSESNTQEL